MMNGIRKAGIMGLVALPCIVHATLWWGNPSATALRVVWFGIATALVCLLWRFRRTRFWTIPTVLAIIGLLTIRGASQDAILLVLGTPHAIIYMVLLFLFGGSLLPGRTPLITVFNTKISGQTPSPELFSYTRNVTIAWCSFFVFQILSSLSLLLFAPVAVWSFFVNVLNLPLIAAAFLCEYGYRLLRFPTCQHNGPLKIAQALYSKEFLNRGCATD